ncbi:MAG: ATP-dependent DNA helicase [Nanoarchaeota archaeon]
MDVYFPHDQPRSVQDRLMQDVYDAISKGKDLLAHAPTGLGKTAATLAPAVTVALQKKKKVLFLTGRHTQHAIAMRTLADIKRRHSLQFSYIDLIGKKWMCLQPNVRTLYSNEFTEYCRLLREQQQCVFYENLKKGDVLSPKAEMALKRIKESEPSTEQTVRIGQDCQVCPYELAMQGAKDALVIVTDYYYAFHPRIRESFLKRAGVELSDLIIIVDEGHNLPDRVKDLASSRITSAIIGRAIKEAEKFGYHDEKDILVKLADVLVEYAKDCPEEMYVTKERFTDDVNELVGIDGFTSRLLEAGDAIRQVQRNSYLGVIGAFLEEWVDDSTGYARLFSKQQLARETVLMLSKRCLDPSVITRDVIDKAFSTIIMSGTLTPTQMYAEVLGFDEPEQREYLSPFPKKNRLNLIIPKTSTKFALRSEGQYVEIAKIVSAIVDRVPGNSAVFFPSYALRDRVAKHIVTKRTVFTEHQQMDKTEKNDFVERFKGYAKTGATLLGVISGNFGEGIDLPGDYLKAVIVVGLPLQKPDLESQALIKYYDHKFQKGWEYGYVLPAFSKTLQSAGRCIRSEDDRGVIVFLDERYTWPNYYKYFPESWQMHISLLYEKMVESFFDPSAS